jgi:hypothetical protein
MSFFGKLLKNPLETAALGAGLYFTGGALAPALMGSGAGTAAASGITNSVLADAAAGSAGYGASAAGGASTGLLGYAQPAMQALSAANSAKGLLSPDPIQSHAPDSGGGNGSQTLASLYQQGVQMSPEDQARIQQRLQRQSQWG